MCSSILDRRGSTLKFKRSCHHPVNVGFNCFAGHSIIELVVQFCDGLPGELLRVLGFLNSEFQLPERFRRERCLGLMVNRAAAQSANAKHDHQQNQETAKNDRSANGELTGPFQRP